MGKLKILITGVGGPTPRSFALSLLKHGKNRVNYSLIGTDSNPLSIGLYQKDLFDKAYVIPPASHNDYWKHIETIVQENAIDMAVILPEMEVMEWSKRMKRQALPCKTLTPDHSLATLLVDKSRMTDILRPLKLAPESVAFSRDQRDLSSVISKLKFPFWVRSSSGTSGLGSLKVENEEALINWISINPNVHQFLASEFLPGRNLACKLLYFEGKLIRAACAERVNYIMAKVSPSGITGNTSFGRLLNEPSLVGIAETAMEHLFKMSGSTKHGFFTVDFKEDAE
ncbi:MAG: hypothetical protein ORN54_00235, partial [Cyclobacteriaceae bacterium]|nr:hypothetical protein [Cyclobacteriaceae bacterium]